MHFYQLVAASRLRDGTSLVDETITPVDGYLDKVVAADRSDDWGPLRQEFDVHQRPPHPDRAHAHGVEEVSHP